MLYNFQFLRVLTEYPTYLTDDELKNYFYTILTSFEKDPKKAKKPAK